MMPHPATAIRFPRRRARFGCGTRCPGHRMSSNPSGCFASPSRIAGVAPSSPTKTKLLTARKIVRYFSSMATLYGEYPYQTV